ncbi:Mitochondrial distribution and morphology protein 31 [Spathaspora sp. JA1]|nr:Mitochondrial distribution and morphology protein 31 [Spathaspora sp. JA1]
MPKQPQQHETPNINSPGINQTKEQLLEDATSIYSRIKVRIKWLLKKSNRPYNTDDYSAIFSWFVVGNVFLFFVATTTFVSIIIFTANTVFAQEFVARKLGEFITKNSKLTVTFEEAIVPGWRDGKISFRKCFVSLRPKKIQRFVKGSQAEAYQQSFEDSSDSTDLFEDDGNYTQYDLTIEEINVSLSFNKWVNGTGIVETLEVKGMRGVVDRTHVHWEPDDDATNYKNIYQPGDFEFEKFKMEDVLFTLKQPNGFRIFDVAIYNCELPKLRKHWLFYDFLNANVMSGSYDDSLFTIHKKQRLNDYIDYISQGGSSTTKRVTRMRVDSLNVDHLNTGLEGPFGWITSGRVDMIGDVMVPQDSDELSVKEIVSIIADSISKEATRYKNPQVTREKHPDLHTRLTRNDYTDISKYFVLDLTIRLNNVRASVPFQTPELSYINYALIRPIVGYINSKNTFIEIHSRIVKNIQDFSGSWTIYDSLLMDDMSEEVYDNFADYVIDEEERLTRMRKVAFWSFQLLAQFIMFGLGSLV